MGEPKESVSISISDLPQYNDMWRLFEDAKKDPESKPLGMMQKLNLLAKRMGNWMRGLPSAVEYDTRRVFSPSRHGEEYKTIHIKNGDAVSETMISLQTRRAGEYILKNEIKSTKPLVPNGLYRTLSQHSSISEKGEQTQIITEGVTLPSGESYGRTQDLKTGKTVFRKNKEGLFWEWTFDEKKRLILSYEGRFGQQDTPDTMSEVRYLYDGKEHLMSATENRKIITPEGEEKHVIRHPIREKLSRSCGRE